MVYYVSRCTALICYDYGPDFDSSDSRTNRCLVGPHLGTASGLFRPEINDHIPIPKRREHDRRLQHIAAKTKRSKRALSLMSW